MGLRSRLSGPRSERAPPCHRPRRVALAKAARLWDRGARASIASPPKYPKRASVAQLSQPPPSCAHPAGLRSNLADRGGDLAPSLGPLSKHPPPHAGAICDAGNVGDRNELPTGTVTLLFTDIEGSTTSLERLGDAYGDGAFRSKEPRRRWPGSDVVGKRFGRSAWRTRSPRRSGPYGTCIPPGAARSPRTSIRRERRSAMPPPTQPMRRVVRMPRERAIEAFFGIQAEAAVA